MRNEFFLFANDKKLKHIVLRWSFAKKSPFQTDKRTETQSVDPSVYLLGLGGTFFWIFQSSHGLHEKTSIVCQQYWWSFNIISTGVLGKLWGIDQQPSSGCLVLRGLSAFWTLASFHRSKIRWSYNSKIPSRAFASSFPIRHTYLFHSVKDFGVFATEETVLNTIEKWFSFVRANMYSYIHLYIWWPFCKFAMKVTRCSGDVKKSPIR